MNFKLSFCYQGANFVVKLFLFNSVASWCYDLFEVFETETKQRNLFIRSGYKL